MKESNHAVSKCRGCGKSIIWATTDGGKRIPLDARNVPVYRIAVDSRGVYAVGSDGAPLVERVHDVYLSHFITCPNREQFSASNRKESAE